jgi:hypothetical protein
MSRFAKNIRLFQALISSLIVPQNFARESFGIYGYNFDLLRPIKARTKPKSARLVQNLCQTGSLPGKRGWHSSVSRQERRDTSSSAPLDLAVLGNTRIK